ncbi:MAG TPA: hypothetical protein VFT91_00100, partial [Dehalococcoidia bacterium]|nr:hypothetical protein [Dehalococcoidia bacterium]
LDALNVETLAGAQTHLPARFLDPGWLDSHTASLSLGGSSTPALQEDNSPAVASGLVTGSVTPAGSPGDTLAGSLTVADDDGGSASDNFQVKLVADDPQRFEPNGDLAHTPTLASGASYLDYIQSQGDIDIFEVVLPGGQPLPAGSELLVTLGGLPADYDLAVLSQLPAGQSTLAFARSDLGQMGFEGLAFARSAFARSAFARSAFARSAFARSAFARSAFARSALTFATFPLSETAFTGLDGTEIGGTDISPQELGIGAVEGTNLRVVDFSANRGLEDETALARSDFAGTRLFVAVFGANGAHSLQPLSIQVETSVPLDLNALLGPDVCSGTPLVPGGPNSTVVLHNYDDPATPADDPAQTVLVTQRERLRATDGLDDAAWNALLGDLEALAQHPAVRADIISLPSTIYDAWDTNPCSVDAANSVTAQVRDIIQARLGPGVKYVVLAGNDNIVPHRRVPDETLISNERDYALDSFLSPGSPLFSAIFGGYDLSDDYYVDAVPSPWQGRHLYVPDLPIGRLVETALDMRAAAGAFLASNGQLNPATGFVSGYGFFSDGSQLTADNLATKLTPDTLINDAWTANDLRCHFLGQGSGCPQAPDVAAVNAHFTHYAALSAHGFAATDFSDSFTSSDVAGAPSTPQKRIVFSMGCHAGLNAPDQDSLPADPGLGVQPALDFPQAFAQRAVYVASTGFGLGDDLGIGGTEKLMATFAQKLMQGDVAAGSALVDAKQTYLSSLSAMTVYDEKSSIQATMYGLPMYRVLTSAGGGALFAPPTTEPAVTQVTANLSLSIQDGAATTTTNHSIAEVTTADGSYFTADGDSQATAGRAIQPRVVLPAPPQAAGPVHGVLLKAGAYSDTPGSNPVIALPTNEWQVGTAEPQTCLPSFWPSELASVNSLDTGGGLLQTFVVIPGQFRCTSGAAPTVGGDQRLYSDLTFELLRSTSSDVDPPDIASIDLRTLDASTVAVTVAASDDPSGIARIVALRYSGGLITATSLALPGPYPLSGDFTLNVSNLGPDDTLVIVAIDGAGNAAYATGKGANLSAIAVNAGPDQVYSPGIAVTIRASVQGFTGLTSPVSFLWDFGDNTFLSGILAPADRATVDVTVDPSGNATFSVQHTYWSGAPDPVTASLKVTDAAGGIGVDDVQFHRCSDPLDALDANADLVSCHVSFNDTANTMTIGLRVAGSISNDYQYRIRLTAGSVSALLKYNGGKVTGLASLQVVRVNSNELRFTFNLADIGAGIGTTILWSAETQAGVPATPETGIVDDMPDAGSFTSVVP